jgi:UDP:flavonoid glycosyltransferase YjiC (YdhE family)
MERLVEVLSKAPHTYFVSKGPQHAEYALADNMLGAEFLPQVSVLPHMDLVITHGGNNTTTECMWFGKPMIVLPIFWDQHDNAQRVHETGCGIRLRTYEFEDNELTETVDRLLADESGRARATVASARLQQRHGTVTAADLIEQLAETHEPVLSV